MATYNGEKYLHEQVDSILAQLADDDELIVSDDGSTDNTLRILESFNDKRIKVSHNKGSHGVNYNFENALLHAKGDIIFLSDQDDVWCQGKVDICLKALDTADCVVHDCFITDSDLNVISPSLFRAIKAGPGFLKNFSKNTFTGCCMAFSKKMLKKILPFPNSRLFYHDQWIGLIATLSFSTVFFHQPLIYFRRHGANTSSASDKSKNNLKSKVSSRLAITKALMLRYL